MRYKENDNVREKVYACPIGSLILCADTNAVTGIHVSTSSVEEERQRADKLMETNQIKEREQKTSKEQDLLCSAKRKYCDTDALLDTANAQLQEYFKGTRQTFDFPIRMNGTPFQEQVWTALMKIPYGETRSYKELAKMIGNPKAVRAVGGANNKNSLMIVIPCHRVIGANGDLVGFGAGMKVKQYLLELEGITGMDTKIGWKVKTGMETKKDMKSRGTGI